MENRVEKYYSPERISDRFSDFMLFPHQNLYTGQKDIPDLISDYLKRIREEGRSEGIKEGEEQAYKNLSNAIAKDINNYIGLITTIVDFTYDVVANEFKDCDFKIVEARTNFVFETKSINILFVLDSSFEKEVEFTHLLNEVEKIVFLKERFICELFCVNKKGGNLDQNAINNDYPFARNTGRTN